jgi:riboflavin synthase
MFTGLVSDIGRIRRVEKRGDTHLVISTSHDVDNWDVGGSVACAGICLTVVDKGNSNDRWFAVTASGETVSKSTLGQWKEGDPVNLEMPLRVGDEFGGHIVTGHVDGTADVVLVRPEGESMRMTFVAPKGLARFIAEKGSIALDGVSLTVNEVEGVKFGVNIIPHTLKVTTFGNLKVGAAANLEIDPIARYVARLFKG